MKDYMLLPIKITAYEKKEENGKSYYYIDGFASVYNNIDLGGDRVLPGFFTEDLAKRGNQRKALWQHNSREPLGIKTYTDTEKGLMFSAKLPADDIMVSGRLIPQLEMGTIEGASIGYSVEISEYNREKGCRDLIKGKLYESSFVSTPMNPECTIYSIRKMQKSLNENNDNESLRNIATMLVKSLNIELENDSKAVPPYKNYSLAETGTAWDENKAVKQIREKTGSKDTPSSSYKNGFMYYDPENSDSFGAYKLPYVYVVDGTFKAVPRALSAIVGALSGARGGVDIPEADKTKIKAQINSYYKKMGREEPFKGEKIFIDTHTLKYMDIKDIYNIFEHNVILSSKAQEMVIKSLYFDENHGEVTEKDNGISEMLKELNKELDKTLKGAKNV